MTPKQQAFVREYLVDLCGTKAAIRAGYAERSAKKIAHELLQKPEIQEQLQVAMAARARRVDVTADRVLQELARVAFFDPRRLLRPDGTPIPVNELDDETAAALTGMDVLEEYEGTGRDRVFVGYTKKVKVADKVAALGLAMRHLGMLKDRVDLTGSLVVRIEEVTSPAEKTAAWKKPGG